MKVLKSFFNSFLAAALLSASAVIPVMAANGISVVLDGKTIGFDVPPQIINERTMVPVRAIFEALGASVDWDGSTQTVTSKRGDTTISLKINDATMYVNGNAVTLDSPACVINERTLVPVRAISEAFGAGVDWDGSTQTVTIDSDYEPTPAPTPKPETYGPIEIGKEYGPMAIEDYNYSNELDSTNNISSLVFTKCERTSIGKYQLFISLQGITDNPDMWFEVYFFDSNNRVIDKVAFWDQVPANKNYNILVNNYADYATVDNAVRIGFYSYHGGGEALMKAPTNTETAATDDEISSSSYKSDLSPAEEYDSFKNQLVEKGTYISSTGHYAAMYEPKDTQTYLYTYMPDDNEIRITFQDTNHNIITMVTLQKNSDPEVMMSEKYKAKSYVLSGSFHNKAFIKDVGNYPISDDENVALIKVQMKLAEMCLAKTGINVDFENLGIPLSAE